MIYTGVAATIIGACIALVLTLMFLGGGVWGAIYLIVLFWIPLVFGNLTLLRSRKTIKPRTIIWTTGILVLTAMPACIASFRTERQHRETSMAASVKAHADLDKGIAAEKALYSKTGTFSDQSGALLGIEPSLKWNSHLVSEGPRVTLGDFAAGKPNLVCLEEFGASYLSVAIIATGSAAGTYYNEGDCNTNPKIVSHWRKNWQSE